MNDEFCVWCGLGPPPIDDRNWCTRCRARCDAAWEKVRPILPLGACRVDDLGLRAEIMILIGARLIVGRDGHYMRPGIAEGMAWVFGKEYRR